MQESRKTNRVEWIDVLKFICMFFIIIHHTDASYGVNVVVGYFPFFLIGFFFASGYVYKRAPFKDFIKKKLRGILLPWGIFAVAVPLIKNLITGGDVVSVLLGNILQIRSYGDSLWFLAALFVAFIPFYFIEKYLTPVKAIALSAALATVSIFYAKFVPAISYNILSFSAETNALPWHIESIFVAMFFMLLGRYFKGKPEEIAEELVKFPVWIIIFIAYVAIVSSYCYITGGGILGLDSYGGRNVAAFFVWIAAVSFGLVSLVIFSKLVKPNKFILYAGANTIIYYILHIEIANFFLHLPTRILNGWEEGGSYTALSIISDYILDKAFSSSPTAYFVWWKISYFIVFISNTLITMAVLIIPSYIINNFAPFLIGKKYPLRTKVYARRVIKKIFRKDLIQMEDEVSYAENRIKELYERGKIKKIVILPSYSADEKTAARILDFSKEIGVNAEALPYVRGELSEKVFSDMMTFNIEKILGKRSEKDEFEMPYDENSPAAKIIRTLDGLESSEADCIVAINELAKTAAKSFTDNQERRTKQKYKIIFVKTTE